VALPVAPETTAPRIPESTEELELDLLLEGIFRRYGYDFRGYAGASLKRRLWKRMNLERLPTLTQLLDKVLHDPACLDRLLKDLSINVTEMFRDPSFHRVLRAKAFPLLRTYPFIRAWVAGCSTGEEVISLAVALQEEGLLERTRIYATDMNEAALARAREFAVPADLLGGYGDNFARAGGKRPLTEYCTVADGWARFDPVLAEGVVYAQHNLASDRSFNEFHLILCRNVMIYFGRDLQRHVHQLFLDSLVPLGLLGLGRKEAISDADVAARYDALEPAEKLFRRRR
jgi:chemotaxis protein methyltransferase CheR